MSSERGLRSDASALLEVVQEPSPASDVREMLDVFRARGYPFEDAWSRALRSLPRAVAGMEDWRSQFHRTKSIWRDAYERRHLARDVLDKGVEN